VVSAHPPDLAFPLVVVMGSGVEDGKSGKKAREARLADGSELML